ncbi:MAG: hypothetical protein P4M11_12915 [Candidatus Pacebacteria bacterium]|nr:hypothetical protein [Candidatus Paceibacterota bacterium]
MRIRLYAPRPCTFASISTSTTSQYWHTAENSDFLYFIITQLTRGVKEEPYKAEAALNLRRCLPFSVEVVVVTRKGVKGGKDEGIIRMWSSMSFASILHSSASPRSFEGEWYRGPWTRASFAFW